MIAISDAAAPVKRALHVVTLLLANPQQTTFDIEVPAPAVLRHAHASVKTLRSQLQRVDGSAAAKREVIAISLVFEVEPDAAPVPKRYYALLYGSTMEGAGVAQAIYAGMVTIPPNGVPIALYDMPPAALATAMPELPSSLVSPS